MKLIFIILSFSILSCAAPNKKQISPAPIVSTADLSTNISKQKEYLKTANESSDRLSANLTKAERLSKRIDDKAILLQDY